LPNHVPAKPYCKKVGQLFALNIAWAPAEDIICDRRKHITARFASQQFAISDSVDLSWLENEIGRTDSLTASLVSVHAKLEAKSQVAITYRSYQSGR